MFIAELPGKVKIEEKPKSVLTLDQMLSQLDGGSIFQLAILAMKRAVEIHNGSPALVKRGKLEKETTIALREIAAGKISYKKVPQKR